MSVMELKAFEKQLDLLSYSEQLSIIEYLAKLLQKKQNNDIKTDMNNLSDKIFALMDENPIYTNGQKWTREELYER